MTLAFTMMLLMSFSIENIKTTPMEIKLKCWPSSQRSTNVVTYPKCPGITVSWNWTRIGQSKKQEIRMTLGLELSDNFFVLLHKSKLYQSDAEAKINNGKSLRIYCKEILYSCISSPIAEICSGRPNDRCAKNKNLTRINLKESSASSTSSTYLKLVSRWRMKIAQNGNVTITVKMQVLKLKLSVSSKINLNTALNSVTDDQEQKQINQENYCKDKCPWIITSIILISIIISLLIFLLFKHLKHNRTSPASTTTGDSCIIDEREIKRSMTVEAERRRRQATLIYLTAKTTLKKNNQGPSCLTGSPPESINCSPEARCTLSYAGIYRGHLVVVKTLRSKLVASESVRKMKELVALDHENVCRIFGMIQSSKTNRYFVTDYCSKGSLQDILTSMPLFLTSNIRVSFAKDIARAMCYVENTQFDALGYVTEKRCYADCSWKIKVSLEEFVYKDEKKSKSDGIETFGCILRNLGTVIDKDSQTKDLDKLLELARKCAEEKEAIRFDEMKKELNDMASENPPHSNYALDLEREIAEKTKHLYSEKQQTDQLLYRLMPKRIAKILRAGGTVKPQYYESCTVCFSDIVGFTEFCKKTSPHAVIQMLNDLYTRLDRIVDEYDIYKMETIGDAYMAVSGVPEPNGARHVTEVANMSLDIVKIACGFVIPGHPGEPLKIRVGFHSGPVCAGVVGTKMPRYCLFGDTVNTASRMESTGEAYRIQCSHASYQLLQKTDQFVLQFRGAIQVKGKGEQITWWLTGRNNQHMHEMTQDIGLNGLSNACQTRKTSAISYDSGICTLNANC